MENIFDIKKKENLDFILSKNYRLDGNEIKKCVVLLVHLYYFESISNYMKYMENIPETVNVIFTVSSELVEKELYRNLKKFSFKYKIINKENRGRDVSALLVAARSELMNYSYIGFLHDKKEKNELLKEDIKKWNYCLWENMLGSKTYVNNVINTLENDDKLGLLVPPIPMTNYLDYGNSNKWSINFENTKSLAAKLFLNCELDNNKPPIALSTVFWAKKSALKKLLSLNWKYEDFDKEPLENDGTISHAIERLLPYVAQDAGFYTGWVMSDEYAAKYLEKQYHIIMDSFRLLNKLHGIQLISQEKEYLKYIDELSVFCQKYSNIYIYGAGNYGRKCFYELLNIGINPKGFIVTSMTNNDFGQLFGINIQIFEDFVVDFSSDKIGIIIAVQKKIIEKY